MDAAWEAFDALDEDTRIDGGLELCRLAAKDDEVIATAPFNYPAPEVMAIAEVIRTMAFMDRVCWAIGTIKAIKRDTERAHQTPNGHGFEVVSPLGNVGPDVERRAAGV